MRFPNASPAEMAEMQSAHQLAKKVFSRPVSFVKSVPQMKYLPTADRPEIAFVGRSNVGKSSLLNALAGEKGLARVSNTPGRTRELNFFAFDESLLSAYLVDLPGYGYARAPKTEIARWSELIWHYLLGRANLRRIFLLIDSRHGIKKNDLEAMDLLDKAAVSYQLVLTKADKIKEKDHHPALQTAFAQIQKKPAAMLQLYLTSSQSGLGVGQLRGEAVHALQG